MDGDTEAILAGVRARSPRISTAKNRQPEITSSSPPNTEIETTVGYKSLSQNLARVSQLIRSIGVGTVKGPRRNQNASEADSRRRA
jgi:hypothetical protein